MALPTPLLCCLVLHMRKAIGVEQNAKAVNANDSGDATNAKARLPRYEDPCKPASPSSFGQLHLIAVLG